MEEQTLLPHLFRTEYRKMVSVLCSLFGITHIEIAEDIVSDTFLSATELWSLKGIPENPVAWLYTVAKNKTKNHIKRSVLFEQKIASGIRSAADTVAELDVDFSHRNIADSQLAMMFTVCNPVITPESQVALALNLLCGFSAQEIADAFLTSKDIIYKRIGRAKEKLKQEQIRIEQPTLTAIDERLDQVLTTLYLLFSEGYYSTSQDMVIRKDLCTEAMRLCGQLIENEHTNKPPVNALMAVMCLHASRFDARLNEHNEPVLYQEQDITLWDQDLIALGTYYLNASSKGATVSKYHLEAGIAYWHTQKEDTPEKWENILQLYNQSLVLTYSPIAALNRTFALAKARGKEQAIIEAEKLQLADNHFYYSLLGNLYTGIDNEKAIQYYQVALKLANSNTDKMLIKKHIRSLIQEEGED